MKPTDTDREGAPQPVRAGLVRRSVALIKRHLVLTGIAAAVGLGLLIFVLVYFQPQKLFIDDRVSEAMPPTSATPAQTTANAVHPSRLAGGSFRGLAHPASGDASILELVDGRWVLRLENFNVENGPDLFVYLSSVAADSGEDAFPGTFINLGKLKGNIGNQNYEIASTVDLTSYRSVVIYCKRFSTPFAVAPLH